MHQDIISSHAPVQSHCCVPFKNKVSVVSGASVYGSHEACSANLSRAPFSSFYSVTSQKVKSKNVVNE